MPDQGRPLIGPGPAAGGPSLGFGAKLQIFFGNALRRPVFFGGGGLGGGTREGSWALGCVDGGTPRGLQKEACPTSQGV